MDRRQFGEASVALFFMITAFMFYSKLLNAPGRFDWKQLYLSRVARIVPLYLVVVLVVFAIVGYLTDWTPRVPVGALLFRGLEWIALGLLGAPALNGFSGASVIVAGVIWSLAYEALFYAWLPHCLVAVLCTPVLVAIAYLLFTCIERPWIEWAHQRGPRFPRKNAVPEAAATAAMRLRVTPCANRMTPMIPSGEER